MNALVIGSGGREHSLAWKLNQSPSVDRVYCAPGNAGMHGIECIDTPAAELGDFCEANGVGLVVVGPEAPLCDGIVNEFRGRGLAIFGPDSTAAQLEGSKAFAKDFMNRHGIPTADSQSFTNAPDAIAYIRDNGAPIVIKADGLAAGKGVTVAETEAAAIAAVEDCFSGAFGAAGESVLVEEYMVGEEASIFAFVDHDTIKPLASSQDHKRVGDGDTGLNTGGMGAYSPAPVVTPAVHDRVMKEIIWPTVNGMKSDGHPYVGFLYAGLMINDDGAPKVIEFNCRFGDPETQPIMMRLQSDLVELCLAGVDGELADMNPEWDERAALGVVLAAANYPETPRKGDVIHGLEQTIADAKVFHAGTSEKDGKVVTSGGRVLCATALGNNITEAQTRAYQLAKTLSWEGMFYRKDIGWRAIAREK